MVLIKYSGKYVKIYFNIKITYSRIFQHLAMVFPLEFCEEISLRLTVGGFKGLSFSPP